jgi:hypothetical protein
VTTRKYEHLVKPLSVASLNMNMDEAPPTMKKFRGPANADVLVWLNGRDHLEGLKLNFSWGFYTGLGDWHPGMDPHVHPYPECLVFVGLDPDNIDYLGAEMQYYLGKELEVYTFDKPTVIAVPAGFPHCPSITKKVTSPKGYGFFIISLGAEPTTTWMGEGITETDINAMKEMADKSGIRSPMKSSVSKKKIKVSAETMTHGNKHSRFIKPLKSPTMTPGPGNADSSVWMYGKDLEGLNVNFSWGYYSKAGSWDRGHGIHAHSADEVLVFVGLDPSNIDYLGAEIEIEMGKEHEKYVFDKPSVVIIPEGTPHNPIVTKRVDKPYAVFLISLDAEHETSSVD